MCHQKIIKFFQKTGKYDGCIDALISLLLDDVSSHRDEESFLKYKQMWLDSTDRGSLYHISDLCFQLFSEIELSMYDTLKTNFDCKKSTASEIKLLAFNDEDVQRLWEADVLICQQMKVMKCCNKSFMSG